MTDGMTDIQRLLWDRMYRIVGEFYEGRIPFHEVVYRLDDAMEVADFHEPWVVDHWRNLWEPLYAIDLELESACACVDFDKVNPLLKAFVENLVLTYYQMNGQKKA